MIRDAVMQVRCTRAEKKAWKAAAEADQRSTPDWIRVTVNAYLKTKAGKR
jgi:hypothetical protein